MRTVQTSIFLSHASVDTSVQRPSVHYKKHVGQTGEYEVQQSYLTGIELQMQL